MKKIITILICSSVLSSFIATDAVCVNIGISNIVTPLCEFESENAMVQPLEELDESLKQVMEEENYIVNLINSLTEKSGSNTNIDNFKFNLEYLKKNYESIKAIKGVNVTHVDSYINAYEIVLITLKMESEKKCTDEDSRSDISSYKPLDAILYANKYYSSYNKAYPDWSVYGGDCANFISQALVAGGKKMSPTWYSYGNKLNISKVSKSWRGANDFSYYWRKNAKSYKTFNSVKEDYLKYGKLGDVVSFLNKNGRAVHTMMITGKDDDDFILTTHTYNTNSARLKVKAAKYPSFIIYNM